MFFTSITLVILAIFFVSKIIELLFGASYSQNSYIPMVIISVSQVFAMAFGNTSILLNMDGREKIVLASQIFALLINIALCILLIDPFGAVGASIGVAVGIVISTLINALWVKHHFGFFPGIFMRGRHR